MPVIKPRTRGKRVVRHIARLDQENNETLHAYAAFIAEPTDYVLNQLVEGVLGRDKEFVAWREQHPESFVPQAVPRKRKGHPPAAAARSDHPRATSETASSPAAR
jgi:hypothetical protein